VPVRLTVEAQRVRSLEHRLVAIGRRVEEHDLVPVGERLRALSRFPAVRDVRGLGFLWAVEFADARFANRVVVQGVANGVVLLQSGPTGTSITVAPPLTIDDEQLARALVLFEQSVRQIEGMG